LRGKHRRLPEFIGDLPIQRGPAPDQVDITGNIVYPVDPRKRRA
jgi:hypothetical protein